MGVDPRILVFNVFLHIFSWNTGNLGLKIIYSCEKLCDKQEHIILSPRSSIPEMI